MNSAQKSQWVHMSIDPQSEARALKIAIFWNIIMFKNGEVDSL